MASMMATKERTPYCGVCFKAGKEKSMYTSHWTRASPLSESEVTCPTILNTVCKYCKEKGHSLKYCKILREKKTRQHSERGRRVEVEYPRLIGTSRLYKDLSDNDGFVKITPELNGSEPTWASIAKNERKMSLTKPELCEGYTEDTLDKPDVSISRISNWGECSDDESECEYDYDYDYEYYSNSGRPCTPIELPY